MCLPALAGSRAHARVFFAIVVCVSAGPISRVGPVCVPHPSRVGFARRHIFPAFPGCAPAALARAFYSLSRWGVRARARPRPPPARACAKSLARESTPIVRAHRACHARSREAMARRAGLGAENLLSKLNMNILRFTWRYTLDSNRLLRERRSLLNVLSCSTRSLPKRLLGFSVLLFTNGP